MPRWIPHHETPTERKERTWIKFNCYGENPTDCRKCYSCSYYCFDTKTCDYILIRKKMRGCTAGKECTMHLYSAKAKAKAKKLGIWQKLKKESPDVAAPELG